MRLDRPSAFAVRWAGMFCLDIPTRRLRPKIKKAQVHNDDAKLLVCHVQSSYIILARVRARKASDKVRGHPE